MPGSDNPTIETRKVSSPRRTQEMIEEFDPNISNYASSASNMENITFHP